MPEQTESMRVVLRTLSLLERSRRRFLNTKLRAHGLKHLMMMTILYLNRNPGVSQDDLNSELLTDKANCSRLCRDMEDMGLIQRESARQDRRQNLLYLTDKGLSLVPVIRGMLDEWRDIITVDLEPDCFPRLQKDLTKMAARAEAAAKALD